MVSRVWTQLGLPLWRMALDGIAAFRDLPWRDFSQRARLSMHMARRAGRALAARDRKALGRLRRRFGYGPLPASMCDPVRKVSLAAALLTALSGPAIFAVLGYQALNTSIQIKAQVLADGLSRHASERVASFAETGEALSAAAAVAVTWDETLRQRIRSVDGKVVLEYGAQIFGPAVGAGAPVTVSGKKIGSIQVAASMSPLLHQTAIVAGVGALLGLLVYFASGMLPLRMLNRAVGEVERQRRHLRSQNLLFNAAVSNMSQGLCMFDADRRLAVSNQRWQEMYGLSTDEARAGARFEDILRARIARGAYSGPDPEGYIRERQAAVTSGKATTTLQEMRDGRYIVIRHQPMPEGGWVATHEDITEQRRVEARVAHLAHHDALTNLPNRTLLLQRIEEATARVGRGGKFAILCLDLDRFKSINDTLGHPVGDELLIQVAQRLECALRETDTVARLGGDEFAIVMHGDDLPFMAAELAKRVCRTLSVPFELDNRQLRIACSIGITVAPKDGEDADQLLRNADIALYRAKSDGRGIYRFFEADMDAQQKARRALELDLGNAIARDQFALHYQPIIDLHSGGIAGFEALLRWQHPERGRVPPDLFIPVAEETGQIIAIGEWVLREACRQAALWPSRYRMSVNLSSVQFRIGNIVELVTQTLEQTGLEPQRLELEITETALLHDNEQTLKALHELQQLGVRIVMDDFGTGYSSLSYLRGFPFDKIKIDRSFVEPLGVGGDAVTIMRALLGLTRQLGIPTTAEGVETELQLETLRAFGCAEIQGYYFSPAIPAEHVEKSFMSAELSPPETENLSDNVRRLRA